MQNKPRETDISYLVGKTIGNIQSTGEDYVIFDDRGKIILVIPQCMAFDARSCRCEWQSCRANGTVMTNDITQD